MFLARHYLNYLVHHGPSFVRRGPGLIRRVHNDNNTYESVYNKLNDMDLKIENLSNSNMKMNEKIGDVINSNLKMEKRWNELELKTEKRWNELELKTEKRWNELESKTEKRWNELEFKVDNTRNEVNNIKKEINLLPLQTTGIMFTSLMGTTALLGAFGWNVHLVLNPSEQIKIPQPASVSKPSELSPASPSKPSEPSPASPSKPSEPSPAFIPFRKKK
ncbi:hypothetical protein RhiirA1_497839 [Rhizophagus irregularis]|uniref:Uncharacterized protein n=1 Tax=Rhizophagus irregularis TaxID=588596 RepID=A0A2N0SJF4_9GLOM|nr:hypothetical protein RhiirA1_497839 [Rhizophagus irregularis]CAB4460543.1 unnamed protein product [Rhizophagus irregularis]